MISSYELLAQFQDSNRRNGIDMSRVPTGSTFGKKQGAHFPTPEALGGTDLVDLLWEQHCLLDLVRSSELGDPYFYPGHVKKVLRALPKELDAELTTYLWSEYKRLLRDGFSDQKSEGGRLGGQRTVELGVGIHGMSEEDKHAAKVKGGLNSRSVEMGYGFGGENRPDHLEVSARGGQRSVELGVGLHGQTSQQRSDNAKKSNVVSRRNGTGFYSSDTQSDLGKKGGAATAAQRWQSLFTGMITSASNISQHHRRLGLPNWRIRLEGGH